MRKNETIAEAKAYTKRSLLAQRAVLVIGFLGAFVLIPETTDGQCSMCRAVTNSNQLTDDAFTVGNGLNNAIVYLMFTPYVMAALFFYAFYRKQITAWIKAKFSS